MRAEKPQMRQHSACSESRGGNADLKQKAGTRHRC